MRTATCQTCHREFTVQARSGPVPTWCAEHHPLQGTARERDRQTRLANAHRQREHLKALEARVAELEDLLRLDAPSKLGPAGKATVAKAVRLLAVAQGRVQTRKALLDLALAAQDWARVLALTPASVGKLDAGLTTPLEQRDPRRGRGKPTRQDRATTR